MSEEFIKLLLIGDSGVGKSCLLARFCQDKFINAFYNTIGVDFKTKSVKLDDQKCKLQIWDTAGQQRFRTITSNYYKGANGILIVFDLTNKDSLNNLTFWLGQIQKHSNKQAKLILVGNKSDIYDKRQVTEEQVNKFARDNNLIYMEASALNAANVDLVFETIARNILVERKSNKSSKTQNQNKSIITKEGEKKQNKVCC